MSNTRTVHIVDDEAAIRRSVGFMLKTSGFAVVTHLSGVAFLREVQHQEHGPILLDLRMPEMDGLEVQQALLERGSTMPVIIVTGHSELSLAVRAMRAGAVDFIEKPFEKAVMLEAIAVAFERLYDSDRSAARAAHAAELIATLTRREQDVLTSLSKGLSNQIVAGDLGISVRTVEAYRASLVSKLSVNSLSEALRIGFAARLEPVPSM